MIQTGYDMTIRGNVNDEAALVTLRAEFETAIAHRNSFPKEAQGTFTEGVDDKFGAIFGATYANADPEYANAQAEVMRISDEIDRANVSYFRLNIWGMARYRDTMEAVGMGYWPEDYPDWPKPEAFGITGADLDIHRGHVEGELTDIQVKGCEDFEREIEYVRSAHPGETPGIPLVKFTSNDGWHVTAVECRSALQRFGEFLVAGYQTLPWEQALAAYRKADDTERRIVASNALVLHGIENEDVGHRPFPGETDRTMPTVLDTISEPYFLDWLRYLEAAASVDGFEVW